MSYVTLAQVQSWLQQDKYDIQLDGILVDQELLAADKIIATLEQRYNTAGWTDNTNTPGMVLRMIAMLVASFILRKAISQDDGIATYCDWLESRVDALLAGLIDGSIDLPGVDPDPDAPLSGSIVFYPTDEATQQWEDDTGGNPFITSDGAARWFSTGQVF
jgi:hypothetical protein